MTDHSFRTLAEQAQNSTIPVLLNLMVEYANLCNQMYAAGNFASYTYFLVRIQIITTELNQRGTPG